MQIYEVTTGARNRITFQFFHGNEAGTGQVQIPWINLVSPVVKVTDMLGEVISTTALSQVDGSNDAYADLTWPSPGNFFVVATDATNVVYARDMVAVRTQGGPGPFV